MIVVIDPHMYSRTVICFHLKQAGYQVLAMAAGTHVHSLLVEQPALVIADQQAWGVATHELVRVLQDEVLLAGVPIVLLMNEQAPVVNTAFIPLPKPTLQHQLLACVQQLVPQS